MRTIANETILADQKKSVALILFDTFMPIVHRCAIHSSTIFNLHKENLQKDHSVFLANLLSPVPQAPIA